MPSVNANQKSQEIHGYFTRIAAPYDFFNHFFSLGTDIYWRHRLISVVKEQRPQLTLDLATGTGDVAIALKNENLSVIGMDFCQPMLKVAQKKNFNAVSVADAHQLPVTDESIDAVTIAFGYRNFTEPSRTLKEIHRILRKDGKLYILEFSQPYPWIRPFYFFYLNHIMPLITGLLCKEMSAYKHLSSSVMAFPSAESFKHYIAKHAFNEVAFQRITLGTVALHIAKK